MEESICPLPLETNLFDRALEAWDKMGDRSILIVDTDAEEMDSQKNFRASEYRTTALSDMLLGKCDPPSGPAVRRRLRDRENGKRMLTRDISQMRAIEMRA
jgi:hypothetical protein